MYDLIRVIDKGIGRKSLQVEVAVKTLPLNHAKVEHIKAEIQHQLAMDHPNICRLLEAGCKWTWLCLAHKQVL